jgi:hypothetical protein
VWTTVTVTYSFEPMTAIMARFVDSPVTITRSASQRMRKACTRPDGAPCQ